MIHTVTSRRSGDTSIGCDSAKEKERDRQREYIRCSIKHTVHSSEERQGNINKCINVVFQNENRGGG
jgi:hypothetical protein